MFLLFALDYITLDHIKSQLFPLFNFYNHPHTCSSLNLQLQSNSSAILNCLSRSLVAASATEE